MKKLTSISVIIILLAGLFWGCEKKENAPVLPPAASMSIDFSNFVSVKKSAVVDGAVNNIAVADKSNWTLAATLAGVWNAILAVNLAVPVASFGLAVNNTPVLLTNNTWQWSYNFNVIGAVYKARLTGQIISTDVKWEMYISREGVGAFNELLWYQGTSKLNGTSGQWILNYNQQFPDPFLQIDWQVTGTSIGDIKYTYIRETKDDGSPDLFKNSYIEYGLTTNALNAFYNIHQNTGAANVFNDVFIEWSSTSHNGHIKSNNYFQDDLWHCWDGSGNNITCN